MPKLPSLVERHDVDATTDRASSAVTVTHPILGREREIAQLLDLVDTDRVRVLSLLGPGGVGKTRLALEIMRAMGDDFAHGVHFISLAPVREAALVPFAVAQELSVQDSGSAPVTDLLANWLRSRHVLLVLDNMEHVVDAAYPWLADLIASCPRLKVLVTSRIALDITGEQRFRVSPLPVPGADAADRLGAYASIRLFAQRARQVRNDVVLEGDTMAAIAAICTRLDGLPLAIELAAARINVFSPVDILDRLTGMLPLLAGSRRDAPPRLRSLRDAIAWSYDLLSPGEQCLFRRLSVFIGGFSLEAAESVAAQSSGLADGPTVPDLVATLVDHSLVERFDVEGTTRYRMLETIREFGLAQLADRGELEAAHDAHAAFYQHLAVAAEAGMQGFAQATWLGTLDVEHGNLREAMAWLTVSGRIADAVELYSHIEHFLLNRAHFMESRQLLDGWLASPELGSRTRAHALALAAVGTLALYLDAAESPIPSLVEALDIFRELGDRQHVMHVLESLSFVWCHEGGLERARVAHEEHLMLARELGDARHEALALYHSGMVAGLAGDRRRQRSAHEASLAAARQAEDLCVMALALGSLGELALSLDGDARRARELINEARTLREGLGDKRNLPVTYIILARAERAGGDLDLAREHVRTGLSIAQDAGMVIAEGDAHIELGRIALLRADLADALPELRQALGLLQHSGYPRDVPECLDYFAELALAAGDAPGAARFLGAADGLMRDAKPAPALSGAGKDRDALVERVRCALDGETFERLRAEAEGWSQEDAVTAALAFDLPPGVADHPESPSHGLSPREVEVLRLLADGRSSQEIADALFLSLRTVTTHITGILGKLNCSSRTAAVAFAIRSGIA
jgi:predicted ATPase/DNA-binding CsgD family transcriptional regulator